jgi:multidrug efflux pump subunit AcrA (membrane-fusion protein)
VQQDYTRRAAALDRREAELRAKEEQLKRAEEALRRTGALAPEKNWPPCYPILHHDIAGEARRPPAPAALRACWVGRCAPLSAGADCTRAAALASVPRLPG